MGIDPTRTYELYDFNYGHTRKVYLVPGSTFYEKL